MVDVDFVFYMSKARDLYKQSLTDACGRGEITTGAQGLIDLVQQSPRLALHEMVRGENGCWRHATVSIQASKFHYCTPRENLEFHCYTEFEVGMPDIPFVEYDSDDGVYSYMPREVIQQYIDSHGGIVGFVDDYKAHTITPVELTEEEITYYSLQ